MENRSGDRARSTPRKRQPITAGKVPERVLKSQSTDRRRGPQKCTQGLRRAISERQFFQGEGALWRWQKSGKSGEKFRLSQQESTEEHTRACPKALCYPNGKTTQDLISHSNLTALSATRT